MLDNILVEIILYISAISTIILVAEATGILPLLISKYIFRRKFANTIEMLKELGCDIEKKQLITKNDKIFSMEIENKLKKITIKKNVEIGKRQNGKIFPEYINLMGATANERNAIDFARELYTFKKEHLSSVEFDFIVTSKLGSPILGYEFAKLIEKPFVLHSSEEKFRPIDKKPDARIKFDFGNQKFKNFKKALIVDDSTTGGRKIKEIIVDLKRYRFEVSDCLVVFAPQGKNADTELKEEGVKLHSIVQTPIKKG
ncbi:MAG: hypothetical protein L3J44_03040 [Campylobacteraceae bacterium]|nr:hypothetical protein [Campylobacteraceae bacterium]